jgi:hypothetical protein
MTIPDRQGSRPLGERQEMMTRLFRRPLRGRRAATGKDMRKHGRTASAAPPALWMLAVTLATGPPIDMPAMFILSAQTV